MEFQPVIGLEVHAQLLTRTKIFCGCATDFGAPPNHHTCPVCLGMPGALPVLNQRVVEFAIRTGLALGCRINKTSVWSRKNYFYPDLPKGYQITQYDQPICEHGKLGDVRIRRIHMEEDAGKSIHQANESLVDLNRAGVPLLEIVSEPDIRDSQGAADYLKAMRDILVAIGVNDGNLEEGSFRCDANVSVMKKGAKEFGTRCELKNINSFRFVRQAIDYEIQRQADLVEAGRPVVQETRLWDEQRQETRSMRSKEEAHDYRYFPEPDLPPLLLTDALIEQVRKTLPELPAAKVERFGRQYGLNEKDARVIASDKPLADFFEAAARHYPEAKRLANWFLGEILRLQKEGTIRFTPEQLAALLQKIDRGELSNNAAKEVLAEMFATGESPEAIASKKGLAQVSDVAAIEAAVVEVLAQNAEQVAKYKAGKKQVLGFLVGQVMRAMQGKGNPQLVNEALRKRLDG